MSNEIEIKIDIQSASLAQLNKELERMRGVIADLPRNSKAFEQASKSVRTLDAAVKSTSKNLEAMDIGQLVGDFGKVGASVGAATALFQQFGQEGSASNEAIQKTLERTQAIIGAVAIAEGVASAARLAATVGTRAATAVQGAYTAAIGASTGALKLFKQALIATGIGAFVVLIGELIANWDKLVALFKNGALTLEEFAKAVDKSDALFSALIASQEAAINKQIANGESLKQVYDDQILTLDRYIKKQQENLEIQDKFAVEDLIKLNELKRSKTATLEELTEAEDKYNESLAKQFEFRKRIDDAESKKLTLNKNLALEEIAIEEEANRRKLILIGDNQDKQITQELKFQNDKLKIMKAAGVFTALEIQKQENEILRIQTDAANKRIAKRREEVKNQLEEILNLYKSEDVQIQFAETTEEEKRIRKVFESIKTSGEDTKVILENLRKEGRTTDATLIEKILGSSKDIKDYDTIIQETFSQKRLDIINNYITKTTEGFDDLSRRIRNAVTTSQKEVTGLQNSFSSFIRKLSTGTEIPDVGKTFEDLEQRIINAKLELEKKINSEEDKIDLLPVSKEEKEILKRKLNEFYKSIGVQLEGEIKTLQSDLIATRRSFIDDEYTKIGNEAGLALANAELEAYRKSPFARVFGSVEKAKREITIKEAQGRISVIDKEYKDIQKLEDSGLLTKKQAEAERLRLTKERAEEEVVIETNTSEDVLEITQASAAALLSITQATSQILNSLYQGEAEKLSRELEKTLRAYEKTAEGIAKATEERAEEINRSTIISETAKSNLLQTLKEDEAKRLAELEEQKAEKEKEIQIKQLENQKKILKAQLAGSIAQAISDAAIGIAQASAKAPATLGTSLLFIPGIIGSLAAAISSYDTQSANIDAQLADIKGFADGGYVSGPGGEREDKIPAMLSNGEFVINAQSTKRFRPLLEDINNGNTPSAAPSNEKMEAMLDKLEQRLAEPPRAYVVYNDIAKTQSKETYLKRRTSI
jgi:hypothetical protein